MDTLKVAIVQANLKWEDSRSNLQHFSKLLAPLKGADLIILPEMFSTGFSMNAKALAETEKGVSLNWMKEIAQKKQSHICGSLIIEEDAKFYNRLYWVSPDARFVQYDKRHLFTYAGEDKVFTAGKEKLLVDIKGWKICPQICYDLRFPTWNRNQENYDLLFFVANWPEKRSFAWRQLLLARAIENMVYTIGVNRVGEDGNKIPYSGNSMAIDMEGKILWEQVDTEAVQTIELSKEKLIASRKRFGFLDDKDNFKIKT